MRLRCQSKAGWHTVEGRFLLFPRSSHDKNQPCMHQ